MDHIEGKKREVQSFRSSPWPELVQFFSASWQFSDAERTERPWEGDRVRRYSFFGKLADLYLHTDAANVFTCYKAVLPKEEIRVGHDTGNVGKQCIAAQCSKCLTSFSFFKWRHGKQEVESFLGRLLRGRHASTSRPQRGLQKLAHQRSRRRLRSALCGSQVVKNEEMNYKAYELRKSIQLHTVIPLS